MLYAIGNYELDTKTPTETICNFLVIINRNFIMAAALLKLDYAPLILSQTMKTCSYKIILRNKVPEYHQIWDPESSYGSNKHYPINTYLPSEVWYFFQLG